jgi:hypothetical protein
MQCHGKTCANKRKRDLPQNTFSQHIMGQSELLAMRQVRDSWHVLLTKECLKSGSDGPGAGAPLVMVSCPLQNAQGSHATYRISGFNNAPAAGKERG